MFTNLPFGVRAGKSVQGLFLQRALHEHVHNRQVKGIVLLLKAAVGYRWLAPAWQHPHCILHERIAFYRWCGARCKPARQRGCVSGAAWTRTTFL